LSVVAILRYKTRVKSSDIVDKQMHLKVVHKTFVMFADILQECNFSTTGCSINI